MVDKKPRTIPKDLNQLQGLINKQHGDGSLMIGRGAIVQVDVFPTGIAAIDKALGVGGLPIGRTMELFGAESSGKTTTCLHFIAACQRYYFAKKERYGVAAFIDAEHAFDPDWASKLGVDVETLLMSQPGSGEEAFQIAETMVRSQLVDLIVIDSIAALVPKAELEGEVGDSHIGAQARLMSQGMRKLCGICSKCRCSIIFINQIREKIGVLFGNPETTPGGRAAKFYATIRAQISKGAAIKGKGSGESDSGPTIGFRPKIKFIKNKVAAPFTQTEYEICVGHPQRPVYGVDMEASLLDVGRQEKICSKSGNFYKFGDVVLGNGRDNALNKLREDTELAEGLRKQIYDRLFSRRHEHEEGTSEVHSDIDDEDLSEVIEDDE
jgi:recombination protein RecA